MSKTSFILDILSIKSATLTMIQDIVIFLSDQYSSARTTGGVIVLEEEFELGPQQINSILKWSQKILNQQTENLWNEVIQIWTKEIKSLFKRIESDSEVDIRKIREDVVDVAIDIMTGRRSSGRIKTRVTVKYNKKWLDIYDKYIEKLKKFNSSLENLKRRDLGTNISEFLGDVGRTLRTHENNISSYNEDIRYADEISNRQRYNDNLSKEEEESWKKFVEKVQFISDIEESADFIDVLRIDIFRNRPQLYEIWILVLIINYFKWNGFSVELLNMQLLRRVIPATQIFKNCFVQ